MMSESSVDFKYGLLGGGGGVLLEAVVAAPTAVVDMALIIVYRTFGKRLPDL